MSYDEQRISDQIDGGLHQQNQQEMTQTMTKEQILPTVSQMDAAIDTIITKMYGGLEAASIEHFLQTGKVNGSFRKRLYDCIKTTFMLVDIKQKTEHLKQLSAERERAGKLIVALNEYIVLLGEELDEVMGFVNAHQWKSTRFEKGEELRQKIKQTLNEYEKEITGNKDHTNPSS